MTSVTTRSKQSNTETLSLARLDIKSFHSHMYLLKNKEKKNQVKFGHSQIHMRFLQSKRNPEQLH